ncbi:MAG TPA: SpoIIE family protein phosphatase [Actinocatenispora sp.]
MTSHEPTQLPDPSAALDATGGYDLAAFTLSDTVRCGRDLRHAARGAPDLDSAAQSVVDYLAKALRDPRTGEPSCALARLFLTTPAGSPAADDRWLSLAGSAGDSPDWALGKYQRIPLTDVASGTTAPLVGALMRELGLDPATIVAGKGYPSWFGVLHVPEPAESTVVAEKRFVREHRVRSIVGFGGTLTGADFFAVLLFSRAAVTAQTADLFHSIAANVQLGLLEHAPADEPTGRIARRLAWERLVGAMESTLVEQALRLESSVTDLSQTRDRLVSSQHQLTEEAELVETLYSVGTQLSAVLDLNELVQYATDAVTRLVGAAFGSFFYNVTDEAGESYLLYALSGVPRERFERFPMPRNTKVFGPTFDGTAIVRSPDIRTDPRYGHNPPYHGTPAGHLPVVSYLAVPVISPTGQVIGGFFFGHPEPGRFTERHERIAVGIAAQTAIAMDNAGLYRQQRFAAAELQRSLLPSLPAVTGMTLTSRYLPATRGYQVGGDWVDVIPLPAGRTALVVGDVMGKGMKAAAVMGQLRTAVRAYAALDMPPAEVLRRLDTLLAQLPGPQLATCVYAVHDPLEDGLCVANAGHVPPAVLGPDGTVSYVDERLGPPLGVGSRPFRQRMVPFTDGARLLLFTDGLIERRGQDIVDGLSRLAGMLAAPGGSDERLVDRLVEAAEQTDDTAVLLARWQPVVRRRTATRRFAPKPGAARTARRFAADALRGWGVPAETVADAVAVTDELVVNAIRHAGTEVRLRVHLADGRLVVDVADRDPRMPRRLPTGPDDEGHRGLQIVESLSHRWGTRAIGEGKLVWAELRPTGTGAAG